MANVWLAMKIVLKELRTIRRFIHFYLLKQELQLIKHVQRKLNTKHTRYKSTVDERYSLEHVTYMQLLLKTIWTWHMATMFKELVLRFLFTKLDAQKLRKTFSMELVGRNLLLKSR